MSTIFFGSFACVAKLEQANIVPVAITCGVPEWYKGDSKKAIYKRCRALAPSIDLTRFIRGHERAKTLTEEIQEDIVKQYYFENLAKRTPEELYQELVNICQSDRFCIIAHESPEEFSHREIVRHFFERGGYMTEYIV